MRIENINKGWYFYKNVRDAENLEDSEKIAVNIPHTWNNYDGQDGGNDYLRTKCCYTKRVALDKRSDKEYYIECNGANSVAELYINGQFSGRHEGGFSRFRFNVTEVLRTGENLIAFVVDNGANGRIYPQMADFTFFGGIYRDVNVLEVEKTRFDLDYYGSSGVTVTPVLMGKCASVTVKAFVTNETADTKVNVEICYLGKTVASKVADAHGVAQIMIDNPMLWNGVMSPNMYMARVTLNVGDVEVDRREIEFGVRAFSVDKDGFMLNGNRYPLRGVSRHQDRLDKGWAITQADMQEDMDLICEVGANTVRLAHYQHDDYFYSLCDRCGIVVWAEIPYISSHLANGDANAEAQMRELVAQCYNHPSIVCWGLSNEITIAGETDGLYDLHRKLNGICHEMDRTRMTAMANVSMLETDSKLLKIPDVMSYNHYFGWYAGEIEDNARWLDDFRALHASMPIGLSEYGAEGIVTLHGSQPRQGDYSEEYQAYYHEKMLEIIESRPYLWATHVWNMFDFASDARAEGGVKGRNNKGLVTYDRSVKKDSFYIYKAHWSDKPFVHICGKRYAKRSGENTVIKVYSNQQSVRLSVNGYEVGSKIGRYVFEFSVKLRGLLPNRVMAESGECVDECVLWKVKREPQAYRLDSSRDGVENWFDREGKERILDRLDGVFSVYDKLGDIMDNPQGRVLVEEVMDKVMRNMQNDGAPQINISNGMMKMASGMTVLRIAKMAGDRLSPEEIYRINKELNKISKGE